MPIAELAAEVLYRTPGVASFNPFDWPVRGGGEPLAYVGVGDDAALRRDPSVIAAIAEAADGEDVLGSCALVFRTLDGATTSAVLDLD